MKVALAYLTKDHVELTKQTFTAVQAVPFLHVVDGSTDPEAVAFARTVPVTERHLGVRGGADAAIVFALTTMLKSSEQYDVVGLCENDVLLHDGWFDATMALFEKGKTDGLTVGAVSPRAYVDRVLIQRDGYAVMHNLGAGIVLFTREAARLVLDNYRTGWWHDNRAIFAQLSGIDIGRYAAFRGNEQWTTADWHFDAVLAQHGLASLALTPAMCNMIGQEPSLEEQGLSLVRVGQADKDDRLAFEVFKYRMQSIRMGAWKPDTIKPVWRGHGQYLYFAHQFPFELMTGDWRLKWSQGFGPFAYRAGEHGCQFISAYLGPVTFLVSGGARGAKVTLKDLDSGYEVSPDLPAGENQIAQLQVPGGMSYRQIILTCAEGAVFYGVQTIEPQPVVDSKFDFHSLPPV